jgi:glutathione S-transferase
MTIQVYGFFKSPYCLLLFNILKELGIPYEFIKPANHEEIKTPEYLATKHPL